MITDYIVSYTNGSGGHFLISMIERTVLHNDEHFRPLRRGQFNDAHAMATTKNFRIDSSKLLPNGKTDAEDQFFRSVKINEKIPTFIPTHVYWPNRQLEKWPNAKLAVILHKEEDLIDLSINGFYKTEMTEEWNDMQRNHKKIYFSPNNVVFEKMRDKHPMQFTPEEITYAIRTRVCMNIGNGYHFIKPITDDPRIFYIQYQDLMTKLDFVVDFVAQVTGKTPSDNVVAEIIKYQTTQMETMSNIKQKLGL